MAEPKLLKVYFWHTRQDGECTPSEEDLKQAIDQQNLKGYVCGVFSEVPADRSDINDYNAMTTTKQFSLPGARRIRRWTYPRCMD